MSLLTRRSLLNPKKGLPDIYQEVEYLWSKDAEPWIDTGYAVTTPDFKLEFKFMRTGNTGTSTWGVDFGDTPRKMHGHFFNNNLYFGSGKLDTGYSIGIDKLVEGWVCFSEIYEDGSGADTQDVEYQLNDFHNIFINHGSNIYDGCTSNDYMFGVNRDPNSINCGWRAPLKIYYFRYYDNTGKLRRDFVPCYRKSDNKPGMYDLVLGNFHVNQGGSEFVLGPEV